MDGARAAQHLRWQALGCSSLGCPFYAALCEELARDAEAGGPVAELLAGVPDAPFAAAHALRLLGGVHRMVLSGAAPALAPHFPSMGGDGDARAAAAILRPLVASRPAPVLDALSRPPQTNEVGRAPALASGLLVVAAETGLPLRLLELGASAGLNLRLDAYRYDDDGGAGAGDPSSGVRFARVWRGGRPPFDARLDVVDRRGCDRDPIDLATDDGALALLAYIWPEPPERMARTRAAIAIARAHPATLDAEGASTWLPRQLATHAPGAATVVFHSVVWQYLDAATKAAVTDALDEAGRRATPDAPLGWLRLEPHAVDGTPAELRLTLWDGRGEARDRLLATTTFHGGPMDWLA